MHKDLLAPAEPTDRKESQELMEQQDHQDLLLLEQDKREPRERQDLQAHRDPQDRMELMEHKDLRDQLEHKDPLERQDSPETMDSWDHLDFKALQD